jgi:sphingomyelin phosphodiesterase acid-like 3
MYALDHITYSCFLFFFINLILLHYQPSHVPDTSSIPDPFGQFAWLEESLQKFRSSSSFVYIVGHIAPIVDSYGGNPQWHVDYIKKYKSIVKAYPDVVKAQLFGHVHSVEFRYVFYNSLGEKN